MIRHVDGPEWVKPNDDSFRSDPAAVVLLGVLHRSGNPVPALVGSSSSESFQPSPQLLDSPPTCQDELCLDKARVFNLASGRDSKHRLRGPRPLQAEPPRLSRPARGRRRVRMSTGRL